MKYDINDGLIFCCFPFVWETNINFSLPTALRRDRVFAVDGEFVLIFTQFLLYIKLLRNACDAPTRTNFRGSADRNNSRTFKGSIRAHVFMELLSPIRDDKLELHI